MPFYRLDRSEALRVLEAATEGRLATCDRQGQPYITPLNYVVWGGKIYFHCARQGRKLDNIAANDKVCFEVSRTEKYYFSERPCSCGTRYVSVLVFGTAGLVNDEAVKIRVLTLLTEKYTGARSVQPIDAAMAAGCCVVEITAEEISGKRNVDPETAR